MPPASLPVSAHPLLHFLSRLEEESHSASGSGAPRYPSPGVAEAWVSFENREAATALGVSGLAPPRPAPVAGIAALTEDDGLSGAAAVMAEERLVDERRQ